MLQNRSLPIALEATANSSNQPHPMLPAIDSELAQFLSGGFIGPKLSYFATTPMVSGGFPANAVDQLWVAYNGISNGNGSLQVGKFPTPIFAPWTSQPLSLTGYAVANFPVGLNDATLADNRWGVSYTQFGDLGLIGNLSYLAGSGPIERAFGTAGEGTAWTGSLQYVSPESRWSGGLAGLRGSYPLPSGSEDRYTRAAALASYSGARYEVVALGSVGHDDNPYDARSPAATSHALSLETIYGPTSWLHVDARYERIGDTLGDSAVNYVLGAAFSLKPNIVLTIDNLASVGSRPQWHYQLLWAGPWYRDRLPPGSMPTAIPIPEATATAMPMSMSMPTRGSSDAAAIANGRAIYMTGKDINGVKVSTATPWRSYQSCAVCHSPNGAGNVLLADGATSAHLGPNAHMTDNMGSMSTMKSPMKPWTLALFERAIAAGVDENGEQLSPVMPRWRMSKRDLHDISLYVLTQIR